MAEGDRLIIDFEGARQVRQIWLANTCQDQLGTRIRRVRVEGASPEPGWSRDERLDGARYFQRIDLQARPTRRLELTFSDLEGSAPACLAELRIF